ncbi:MAG TPA: hypothetical protein VK611_21180 [Acidimicrobiales bacterium]|nr:hypothetical protein [Acidimicrobiales bacterium]
MPWDPVVLELEGLRIEATPRPSWFDRWFECRISVVARPFAGVLETIFTDEDFVELADQLERLDPGGDAMLGGDRAAELRFVVEVQQGGNPDGDLLAVECTLTPSGDDPYPLLRFLIFKVPPLALARAAERLRALAALDPWPKPP